MYNGILEVYLDMEAHISSVTKITQKEPKETTKERGISLTIMGQRQSTTQHIIPAVTKRNARV